MPRVEMLGAALLRGRSRPSAAEDDAPHRRGSMASTSSITL